MIQIVRRIARFLASFVTPSKPISRPKTARKEIVFASTERLSGVEDLAPRFFSEILGLDYADCLITDESELGDFRVEATSDLFYDRIAEVYGVNVRDIESGNIVEIMERLRLLASSA